MKHIVPLPVVELSHLLGSLSGALLLLLAWGLMRRLNGAYLLTLATLGAGIVFSLLKGFDYEEALALGAMLLLLLPCRKYFYRKTSLADEPFTWGWTAAVAVGQIMQIIAPSTISRAFIAGKSSSRKPSKE